MTSSETPSLDVSALPDEVVGEQIAHPRGEVGVAVIERLALLNEPAYAAALTVLQPEADDRVLEIGFGTGHLIPRILSLAPNLVYEGLDASSTMVERTGERHRDLVAAGRVTLREGSSDALPYRDASFDRVLTLNTIFFWADPARDLAECRRVLRPSGLLVLCCGTPEQVRRSPPMARSRAYDEDEIRGLLEGAGFGAVVLARRIGHARTPEGAEVEREFFVLTARPG